MKDRLSAVAEETLLTLAPLDLEGDAADNDDGEETRRLVVLASSEGSVADLEFIGGGDEENLEDRIRQLQQHDEESLIENEISLLCCGATLRPCGISSITAPTSSRFASAHRGRDRRR